MNLTMLLLTAAFLNVSASGLSQSVTFSARNAPLDKVFSQVEKQTGYVFFFDETVLQKARLVTIRSSNQSLENFLRDLFRNQPLTYLIQDKTVIVKYNTPEPDKNAPPELLPPIGGRITDAAGNPVAGVNIAIKGTTMGTTTDADGRFSINAEADQTLVVSSVGFETREIEVGSRRVVNVTLKAMSSALDEVVVIGYGKVKKSDLTGSVSSVDSKEAFKSPVSSVDQALQGRAAGVNVTSISGAPGSGTTIRIRGGNSITAGNEPLYVIDGFIGGGDLSSIDPNDIESIEVLKDASSASIYGTRGSNGVILITTKKGAVGKPEIRLNSTIGKSVIAKKVAVQNPKEFAQYQNEGAVLNGVPEPYDLNDLPEGTDWQEVGLRNALTTSNTVSVNGGSENTQVYLSGNYFNQQGILKANGFKRYSFRLNMNQKLFNFIRIGANINYSRSLTDNPKYAAADLFTLNPLTPVYDENGEYSYEHDDGSIFANPIARADLSTDKTTSNRFLSTLNVEFLLSKTLSFKTSLGTDLVSGKTQKYLPGSLPDRAIQELGGEGSIDNLDQTTLLNENILSFDKSWGQDHSINAIAGFTVQSFQGETSHLGGTKLSNDATTFYALQFTDPQFRDISSGYSAWNLASFIGRINYSLKDKYLFTASFRRDGSSRLGKNNKWANFPSAAIAWRLSEEPFIKNLAVFDNLKLRTSYGLTGNQGIPVFSTLASLSTLTGIIDNAFLTGVQQGSLENPNIKWETTGQFDIGLEAGFFRNRLNVEVDYYYKKTKNLLFDVDVPVLTGFQTQLQNVGSLENDGIEVTLNAKIITGSDFSWTTALNVSHYHNRILDLGVKKSIDTYRLPPVSRDLTGQLIVGQPLGIFVGYTYTGIDPVTGDLSFEDKNKDGLINESDRSIIGNSNPDFFGGIQNNLKYKNLELSLFFQGSYGNDLYNTRLYTSNNLGNVNSYRIVREGRWTAADPENAAYPAPGKSNNTLFSNTSFIQNGSYLRLKTVTLSYSLPVKSWKNHLFKEISISFIGTNLFLVKDKDYLNNDPEVSQFGTDDLLRGYDNIVYPQQKSYTLGVNMAF